MPPMLATANDLILYVDCVPQRQHRNLAGYVAEICRKLEKAGSLDDIRLADAQHPFGFGKWKGAVAAAVRLAPPTGPCVISSSDLTEPIIETLAAIAVDVVRARR